MAIQTLRLITAGICVLILILVPLRTTAADRSAQEYDKDIATLAAAPEVQAAFRAAAQAESERNIARLIELTEIPAPPFGEQARGRRFLQMLTDTGIDRVQADAVGNVLAYWPGDGRDETVAVVAHLDTVFPADTDLSVRGPEIDDSGRRRWYAPGIGDNSRGLVLMLTLIESMRAAGVETERNILFVASVGEEGIGDLRGMKHLFREGGPQIDALIAVDGGNDNRVLNQGIGSHRYRVRITGPGGHSWGAFGMANPAHALASGIHSFEAQAQTFIAEGERTTFNIGLLGGGTSVNAIPFESWAEVDMRSEAPERLQGIDALLHRSFDQAVTDHNERRMHGDALQIQYESIGRRPSGTVPVATPLIQRALAVGRYFGLEPELGSGSTDANVAIAGGIPATTISRGGVSGGAHSLAEWWSDEQVVVGTQKALLLVLSAAGLRR